MSETTQKNSSYKKLFSNTIIFAIGSFSSKILVLLLVNVYTTYLSTAELGINEVITSIANWMQPIVTLTISEAVIRFGLDKAYNKKATFTIGNIICAIGLGILAIVIPIVTISGVADKYLNGYSLLLYCYIFMSSLKLLYSTFVRALEKVRLFAINGILTTLFMLIGTYLFICVFKMGNTGYLLSIIVSDFLSIIFLMFTAKLWKYIDFKRLDKQLLRTMLQYSVPLIPAQLLWLITNTSDTFMTTHYLGLEANGILGASYKIPNLVATVYLMFGQAWNMSAILENDSEDRNRFYSNVFNLNQSLLYLVAAGCLLIVQPLTAVWIGPAFQDSMKYAPILIFSSVFSCFTTFMGSIYLATKQTKRSLFTSLISGVINIVLNVILIPRIGLYAPAISTLTSYFVVFVVRAYDSRKLIPFYMNFKKLVVNNIILLIMVLTNVLQFFFGTKKLTMITLPILFIIVFVMNFTPLWDAAQHMLPEKFAKITRRISTKAVTLLAILAMAFLVLAYITHGILLFIAFGICVVFAMLTNRMKLIYASIIAIFLTAWGFMSFATGITILALIMTVPLIIYRKNIDLVIEIILADIVMIYVGGIYLAIFCLMIELIIFLIMCRKQIFKTLEKMLFKR